MRAVFTTKSGQGNVTGKPFRRNCTLRPSMWAIFPGARAVTAALLGAALAYPFFLEAASAATVSSTAEPALGIEVTEHVASHLQSANFGNERSSPVAKYIADWVVDSADNRNLPFIVIDKVYARVYIFDGQGQLKGASSALLGLAIGDDSVPGIGQRKLSSIRPAERTTPAGRFVASLDRDIHGQEVLWVDYDAAISLHPVVKGTPSERRAARLASHSASEKRISYGCINVPVNFYENVVSPLFTGTSGIVYVLPETRAASVVFGSYDIGKRPDEPVSARQTQASTSATR